MSTWVSGRDVRAELSMRRKTKKKKKIKCPVCSLAGVLVRGGNVAHINGMRIDICMAKLIGV